MNILIIAILAITSLIFIVFLLSLIFAFYKIRKFEARIDGYVKQITEFITPVDEKSPSPLAQTTDAIASVFSRSIVAQIKTSLMGASSGVVRREQAVNDAMVTDQIPLMGILSSFPTVKKALLRNPGLIDAALGIFSKKTQSQPGENHKDESQAKFSL